MLIFCIRHIIETNPLTIRKKITRDNQNKGMTWKEVLAMIADYHNHQSLEKYPLWVFQIWVLYKPIRQAIMESK